MSIREQEAARYSEPASLWDLAEAVLCPMTHMGLDRIDDKFFIERHVDRAAKLATKALILKSLLGQSCLTSQTLLPPRFNGQAQHGHQRGKHESTTCVNRRLWVASRSVDCDNRRADSGHTIQETGDTRPRPAARRWEDLGRVRVQHTVHDVLEEGLDAGEDELEVGVGADGEEEQTDAREKGRSGHRALAANELDVDGVAGDDGTRDTANRDDGVVAVDNVCWRGRGVGVDAREILGQEGVEQGISHSNRSPAEPQKGSVDSEALVGEERSDALGGELLSLALDNVHCGEFLVWDLLYAASYRVENLLADPGLGLVLVGNTSDDGDGLALAATAEQELWRLKQVEEEEAADEHGKGEGSHGEVEISPAHVELLGTARLARADVTTVTQRLVARVVGDEAPGKERSDQLANGPEDTEHGEEVAAGKWQELEEQGTVDWQVAANATSECGVQTADGDPVVGASNRKAENTSHEEGDVECWASSDRVAGNTPKGSTDTQSHEERQRGKSDLSVRNAKLGRERGRVGAAGGNLGVDFGPQLVNGEAIFAAAAVAANVALLVALAV
ncbi:hypothetical protein V502_00444 [Pseudogymnoascus sp. VKM F-4520 (FW-2644)]|nr:hypothetical protein V502_00444 [Pseudogymnoascus sp. VKM F-4520 (FW-2644)]